MGALVEYNPPMSLPSPHARLGNMIPLDRLKPALRSAWLPLALLLIALSTVFIFGGDRGDFYRPAGQLPFGCRDAICDGRFHPPAGAHNWMSSEHLTIAVNLSPEHGFQRFAIRFVDEDGAVGYIPYNRFPIGGYVSMKLATLPVSGNPSAQITAARVLMLLFFSGVALLAYLSLCRLVPSRWVALTATLLAFSSYYLLYYNDMTANEGMVDLFGVMLAFHGMVVFMQEGRFRQLLVKTCIALLLGWHVLALLLPFVIFGLASDLIRERSAASPVPDRRRGTHAAAALLRSRFLLLGVVAILLGLATLTFNFAMDYIALDGETTLTELPVFDSILRRTSIDQGSWPWTPFLDGQFRSIFRMFIPYALLGGGDATQTPLWLPERWGVVLGIALAAASMIGSVFVRPRILFATLASFGFFWALPMRQTTALHDFEAVYYIGLPLVLFTIALLLARRLTNRDGAIAAASVAALMLFTVSSFQMSRVAYSAEAAQATSAAKRDILAIRELTKGEIVTTLGLRGIQRLSYHVSEHAPHYYMNSILMDGRIPPADRRFVMMRHRIDIDSLLTPQNQYFFLYDAKGLTADLTASYRSAHPSVVSTEPLARQDFNVYLDDDTLYYVKEPCQRGDTQATFVLHVFPADIDDLPYYRREYGFDNLDFLFIERGVMFDGKCLASVDLPQYDVAGFRTGSHDNDGQEWTVAHVVQGPKLISEYRSIVSTKPAVRSEFDLYVDGGKLYYVKEPCGIEDTQVGFFLHVVPADLDDLPGYRREYGFDNLDFGFDVRGVQFDGKCVASVGLPQYAIARITTGQYDGTDRIWEVKLGPDAIE